MPGGWGSDDALLALAVAEHDQAHPLPLLGALLDPASANALYGRLFDPDDRLDVQDLRPVAAGLARAAYGRSWWETSRILSYVLGSWADLDGALGLAGVDLAGVLEQSPARGVNLVRAWLTGRAAADPRAAARLEAQLVTPPIGDLGNDLDSDRDAAEFEGAMFMASVAQSGGRYTPSR